MTLPLPLRCFRDKRKWCLLLFIILVCGLISFASHHDRGLRHVFFGSLFPRLAKRHHVSVTGTASYGHELTMAKASNISSRSSKVDDLGKISGNSNTHYDFVAFKKKSGWHFVKFPCHYQCKEQGVSVTVRLTDSAVGIAEADAVFFSTGPITLDEWHDLHRYRRPGQIWLMATQEPASIVPRLMPPRIYRYTSYNWSLTYHSSSDIHGAYGWYTPNDNPSRTNVTPKNWHAAKPRMASWVSSRHCEGLGWDRTRFVLDLAKFIKTDMYGACGNKHLSRDDVRSKSTLRTYKFHLSMENSCCSEYLSEKVWNTLERWESVPIVLGGTREEYHRLMPPHSYIHADDFDSIADLARYIKAVSENATLYNEYFAWRMTGIVRQQGFRSRFPVFKDGACKIADKIKRTSRESPMKQDTFDPYGATWFGSCYRCGDHSWIQDYNFWWRRTIFGEEWQENRTLYWENQE